MTARAHSSYGLLLPLPGGVPEGEESHVDGGTWREAFAGYGGALAHNVERWAFKVPSVTYGPTVRFAVRYRVACQALWDNNGGADSALSWGEVIH